MLNNGLRRAYLLLLTVGLLLLTQGAETAVAQNEPTIAKDSVRVKATRIEGVWKNGHKEEGSSWLPAIEYRVNGPIANGSHLSVEFSLATNAKWLKFDCADVVLDVDNGYWWKTECGALTYNRSVGVRDEKSVTFTGPVNFTIHLRNEVRGTDTILFNGVMKVAKYQPRPQAPSWIEYYVDDDWRIPLGYIGFEVGATTQSAGQRYQAEDSDILLAAMEFRGKAGDVKTHLFYQGKELAQDWCSKGENSEGNPAKYNWGEIECKFRGVYRSTPPAGSAEDPRHNLSANPGEYEIKVTSAGRLSRSMKFTVGSNGKFDNGIANSNKLGSRRVIVPVQVIGDQGPWDRSAWKTGAFYGNPLSGFAALP